jgi:DNA polymerase-3 subunit alpha
MHHELDVIERMGFISYFLINQDIVRPRAPQGLLPCGARQRCQQPGGVLPAHHRRGPMELDLYFERFINPARKKPPDFDIDFSWKDRDEVFSMCSEVQRRRVPCAGIHAAQIATYTTFQWRGAMRELGKAVGFRRRRSMR